MDEDGGDKDKEDDEEKNQMDYLVMTCLNGFID